MSLAHVFWIVAGSEMALLLAVTLNTYANPTSRMDGYAVLAGLVVILALAVIMGVVALIRRPMAYGIGLALVLLPFVLAVLSLLSSM
jgi:hypothetical protein